jgi:hypothetical protein
MSAAGELQFLATVTVTVREPSGRRRARFTQ